MATVLGFIEVVEDPSAPAAGKQQAAEQATARASARASEAAAGRRAAASPVTETPKRSWWPPLLGGSGGLVSPADHYLSQRDGRLAITLLSCDCRDASIAPSTPRGWCCAAAAVREPAAVRGVGALAVFPAATRCADVGAAASAVSAASAASRSPSSLSLIHI